MSEVKVLPVPEGSIIWVHNIDLGEGLDVSDIMPDLMHGIGHNRFVLLNTNGEGEVEVLGPDDDLVARVRAALEDT